MKKYSYTEVYSFTCPFRWTLAVVGVDSIHTGSAVLAFVGGAVIDVDLTVCSIESL